MDKSRSSFLHVSPVAALRIEEGVLVYDAEATGDLVEAVRAHREGRVRRRSPHRKRRCLRRLDR